MLLSRATRAARALTARSTPTFIPTAAPLASRRTLCMPPGPMLRSSKLDCPGVTPPASEDTYEDLVKAVAETCLENDVVPEVALAELRRVAAALAETPAYGRDIDLAAVKAAKPIEV